VIFERVARGEGVEATFEFNCWLAPDTYSISVAVHSADAISFDWMDGVLFFRVVSETIVEGVANLNASVTTRRLKGDAGRDTAALKEAIKEVVQ
jgi:hypothetical protein